MIEKLRAGTRKSQLAMRQTELTVETIQERYPKIHCEMKPLQTMGDKILDRSLVSFGGKGIFIEEFEQGLLDGSMDFAVHSAKDMPAELSDGLELAAVLKREDPRDVLIWRAGEVLEDKPSLIIGTGSKRREIQIKRHYDCTCRLLRGNVNTRLSRLEEGEYDAIILAAAGLKRLGLIDEEKFSYRFFSTEEMVPSGGQGIIAVEAVTESATAELLHTISDENTYDRLLVERYLLERMNAGCHEPIGVYSEFTERKWLLRIMDGRSGTAVYHCAERSVGDGQILETGYRLADELLEHLQGNVGVHPKRVGITGTEEFIRKIEKCIDKCGAKIYDYPYVEIKTRSAADCRAQLENLETYQWIVFTSANGVRCFFAWVKEKGLRLSDAKFAVIGRGTAGVLSEYGHQADFCPSAFYAETLGREFAQMLQKQGQAKQVQILIPRAADGSKKLTEPLDAAGISYLDLPIYDTRVHEEMLQQAISKLPLLDAITFASASGVRFLCERIPKEQREKTLGSLQVLCIGRETARALESYGIKNYEIAEKATAEGLAQLINKK